MANDRLRQALQDAGLQPDQLADLVAVDERTVRRWLTGVTPYARHRGRIARTLATTEHDLWPEIPQPAISDSVAAYADADASDAPTTEMLIRSATDYIDLVDNTLLELESADLNDLLLAKASEGCSVRILVNAPGRSLGTLLGHQRIEIRLIQGPPATAIRRVDDQVLVSLSLDSEHDEPVLHVRERRAPGLFARLTRHFESTWERASETLASKRDFDSYLREQEPDAVPPDYARDTGAFDQPVRQSAEASPRRWPRRPE